jgi:flagellar protein FlaF
MSYRSATQYQRLHGADMTPQQIEIAVFEFVTGLLAQASDGVSRIKALGKNHELWSALIKHLSLSGNTLPPDLKSRLVELGEWAMTYSIKAMCDDLSVQPLIEVNRNIADGLRSQTGHTGRPVSVDPLSANGIA